MRQQINLYQPIFSHERKQLSALTVASGLGVILLGLLGMAAYADYHVDALEQNVVQLRERAAEQDALLQQAGALQAARGNPVDIQARVKQLGDSVTARRKALTVLQAGAAGQTTGFASRIEALARRHVDGLWIDGLVLSGTTGSMTLQGATLDADTVPAYLLGLAHEHALTGTRFDDFVIERPGRELSKQPSDETVAEEGAAAPQPRPVTKHIRFRAGSKSLAADAPEAST